jgi:hypothetical protein
MAMCRTPLHQHKLALLYMFILRPVIHMHMLVNMPHRFTRRGPRAQLMALAMPSFPRSASLPGIAEGSP